MVQISKVSMDLVNGTVKPNTKKALTRITLPTVSGLAVLAGSSMQGNDIPPANAGQAEPGSSVTDSISDQLKHTLHQAQNAGEEIVDGVKEGAKSLLGHFADFLDDIF